ncbi:MAG: efflux RND transporter periplasmic adaptor subunit [Spirochaetaceae bacterium]|nr:efflux RND transporter periplasmic adaptor subunit [Spirochaetaceae bacterium]
MMMTQRSVKVVALVFASAFVFFSCSKDEGTAVVPVESQETVFAVNTYVAAAENLDEYLEFGGDVVAASSVDVMPDTSGKIANIRVRVGDYVEKNQILAYVDPSRPGMTYESSPIRAPVAGTVTAFPVSVGSMVAPSVSIAKISNTKNLEINISVAERFVSRIEVGQPALLTFDSYPGEVFTAKVAEVNPVLDTTSRSMGVKLVLDPPDNRIKIGMYCRVKLITESKSGVVAIPREAIVNRSGQESVFVVNGNTVENRTISVGITVDNMVEVVSGLSAGNEVVVSGQTLLDSGSKVNVINRQQGGN